MLVFFPVNTKSLGVGGLQRLTQFESTPWRTPGTGTNAPDCEAFVLTVLSALWLWSVVTLLLLQSSHIFAKLVNHTNLQRHSSRGCNNRQTGQLPCLWRHRHTSQTCAAFHVGVVTAVFWIWRQNLCVAAGRLSPATTQGWQPTLLCKMCIPVHIFQKAFWPNNFWTDYRKLAKLLSRFIIQYSLPHAKRWLSEPHTFCKNWPNVCMSPSVFPLL